MTAVIEAELQVRIEHAAQAIRNATALLFTTGAGMGVDSGLPDFRGPEGFWKAYPPMKALGLEFPMMSNPVWFTNNPPFAWGFWAHRKKLYKNAEPHYGYEVLKKLGNSKLSQDGYFSFTSNVDGAFVKAGFDQDRLLECHGSIHWMQCTGPCTQEIWSGENLVVEVDESTFLSPAPLPKCKNCSRLARPNVLMFGDDTHEIGRYVQQKRNYERFLSKLTPNSKLVVIEVGAGTAVPTVRRESERRVISWEGTLIRINMRDTDAPEGAIVLPIGGKDALTRIENEVLGTVPL